MLEEVEVKYYCLFIPEVAVSERKGVFLGKVLPIWETTCAAFTEKLLFSWGKQTEQRIFLLVNVTNEKNKLLVFALEPAPCIPLDVLHQGIYPEQRGYHSTGVTVSDCIDRHGAVAH